MSVLDDLRAAAKDTARAADALSARFARLLAGVLRDTERRLRPMLREVATGSRTAIVRAAQANRMRRQLRDVLETAGYDALIDASYGTSLDRITDRVLAGRRLAAQAADLTPRLAARLEALKALHATDLLDEGDAVARALWQATVRGLFAARDAEVILADLADVLDHTEPQIATLYDTSISIFGRQVEALQAGNEPDTPFLYVGPDDEKTRPFCKKHLNKVYTREEIDALDNGQLDNVFLTAGGYQCRHMFIEVSRLREAA